MVMIIGIDLESVARSSATFLLRVRTFNVFLQEASSTVLAHLTTLANSSILTFKSFSFCLADSAIWTISLRRFGFVGWEFCSFLGGFLMVHMRCILSCLKIKMNAARAKIAMNPKIHVFRLIGFSVFFDWLKRTLFICIMGLLLCQAKNKHSILPQPLIM